jgi:hypothetical protein
MPRRVMSVYIFQKTIMSQGPDEIIKLLVFFAKFMKQFDLFFVTTPSATFLTFNQFFVESKNSFILCSWIC